MERFPTFERVIRKTYTPRLVTNFKAHELPIYQQAVQTHPELPIFLNGNSLWISEEVELTPFWQTFDKLEKQSNG